MANLLMIESWLQSTGLMLPPLLRDGGHHYVLVTRDPDLYRLPDGEPHPVLALASDVVVAETNDDAALVAAARAVAARRRIDGVLTTCDYYLPAVALVAEELDLPGAPADVLHTATRKHLVRQVLAAAGVPDVPFAVAATWDQAHKAAADLGYPLVVKPVDMNSGTGVRKVLDEAGLAVAFAEAAAPERNTRDQRLERLALLERVLDGPEFSVESVTRDGVTRVLGITAKSVAEPGVDGGSGFVESGHLFPAPLAPDERDAIERHVVAVLGAVGLTHGISHTEVRVTASGPRLIELNPRQGGGYIFELVRLVTGFNPLQVLVDLALGREPVPGPSAAKSAAVTFLLPASDGVVREVRGAQRLADDDRVLSHETPSAGRVVRPGDNNERIGHVLVADPRGQDAKTWSDELASAVTVRLDTMVRTP
ncbi:Biotin carboxylase [Promicromonospora umidemergens]|uniref:ATP-grasp domain-containing protein n=1 Tax=Promicromonospora umidemergens TaxID=629679 RepID=A0ABP8WH58_9MICO|nr:ATP-grasp domain-containing protein [Promicromonospora umidemergens]MCP2284029.1 Biotin carboxylase [Promicromonospora umidemergens]